MLRTFWMRPVVVTVVIVVAVGAVATDARLARRRGRRHLENSLDGGHLY